MKKSEILAAIADGRELLRWTSKYSGPTAVTALGYGYRYVGYGQDRHMVQDERGHDVLVHSKLEDRERLVPARELRDERYADWKAAEAAAKEASRRERIEIETLREQRSLRAECLVGMLGAGSVHTNWSGALVTVVLDHDEIETVIAMLERK